MDKQIYVNTIEDLAKAFPEIGEHNLTQMMKQAVKSWELASETSEKLSFISGFMSAMVQADLSFRERIQEAKQQADLLKPQERHDN